MNHPLNDRRTLTLLNRVSDDLSTLRGDLATLLGDTTRRVIPEGAREVSRIARRHLSAGGNYAKNHLPARVMERKHTSLGLVGGTVALGAVALVWYFIKDRNAAAEEARLRDLEFGPQGVPTQSGEI